nr:hypothetical protein CFP56_52133 [Quercus suber]
MFLEDEDDQCDESACLYHKTRSFQHTYFRLYHPEPGGSRLVYNNVDLAQSRLPTTLIEDIFFLSGRPQIERSLAHDHIKELWGRLTVKAYLTTLPDALPGLPEFPGFS